MCAWAVVVGAAIPVVGGALLSDDHGAGDANSAVGQAALQQAAIAQDQWDTYKSIYRLLEIKYANRERYAGDAAASLASSTKQKSIRTSTRLSILR
ncbi:MAG: hypothetical protein RL748_3105 [Pseudomonadota bacterium]|jgi:hypothetical protein